MEAWGLPHLTESPTAVLYNHGQMAISRFETCEISLKTGSLRIIPLNEKTIALEGLTSKNTRRFLLSATTDSWKLSPDTPLGPFHEKLGQGDAALIHLTNAIRRAYRTGKIHKISNDVALSVREELTPKPLLVRGEAVSHTKDENQVVKAWAAVDALLQSPTATKHIERAITNDSGKVVRHLLITFQEPKQRFILEMIPFPRPFDSRPTESITITKNTISHFDPDGPEPFTSQERALEVFGEWMALWENR
jgi:hypothetical protein